MLHNTDINGTVMFVVCVLEKTFIVYDSVQSMYLVYTLIAIHPYTQKIQIISLQLIHICLQLTVAFQAATIWPCCCQSIACLSKAFTHRNERVLNWPTPTSEYNKNSD